MNDQNSSPRIPMHITRGFLVVPIQIELTDEAASEIKNAVLQRIHEKGVKGVLIDLSEVEIADSFLGKSIRDIGRMAGLLGATPVITGLKPGVVASLVDLDIEFGDIPTLLTLEDGFQRLTELTTLEEPEFYDEEENDNEIIQDSEDQDDKG